MKAVLRSILVTTLFMVMALPMMAQDKNKAHMLGLLGGVAFTSNPPALQKLTDKSHYVDGNGGLTYLYHNNVTDGYAFEWQLSFIGSSVNTLESADNETKVKFIMPLDFRWFLGNCQKIQAYVGLGLQYNTVWLFTSGEDYDNTYYDPWWGVYYTETTQGEDKWDWTVNQLSTNVAIGFKIPFWKIWVREEADYIKMHNIILGLKGHFPIINASEYHGDENSSVDLSRDKVKATIQGEIEKRPDMRPLVAALNKADVRISKNGLHPVSLQEGYEVSINPSNGMLSYSVIVPDSYIIDGSNVVTLFSQPDADMLETGEFSGQYANRSTEHRPQPFGVSEKDGNAEQRKTIKIQFDFNK